jgi:predicted nucleic acid-binding protein
MVNIFLDSDIVIDFYKNRMPFATYTSQIFKKKYENKLTIFITALSINNIHYVIRKDFSFDKTMGIINQLVQEFEIIPTNKTDLKKAIELNFSDYEDAIQVASAMRTNKIQYILTRNVKDYHKSPIPVLTPEEFLNMHNY